MAMTSSERAHIDHPASNPSSLPVLSFWLIGLYSCAQGKSNSAVSLLESPAGSSLAWCSNKSKPSARSEKSRWAHGECSERLRLRENIPKGRSSINEKIEWKRNTQTYWTQRTSANSKRLEEHWDLHPGVIGYKANHENELIIIAIIM